MNIIEYVFKTINILESLNIEYVLVGGFACILMGINRLTEDIDFIIKIDSYEKALKLAEKLNKNSFKVSLSEVLGAFKDKGHFTILVERYRIDFKIASSTIDFITIRDAVSITIDSHKIRLARLEDLIATKITVLGSLKDIEDALKLMILHSDKIEWKRVKKLAGKNIGKEIYKILSQIEKEFRDNIEVMRKIDELKKLLNIIKTSNNFEFS